MIKAKVKEKKRKNWFVTYIKEIARNQPEKHTSGIDKKNSLLVPIFNSSLKTDNRFYFLNFNRNKLPDFWCQKG